MTNFVIIAARNTVTLNESLAADDNATAMFDIALTDYNVPRVCNGRILVRVLRDPSLAFVVLAAAAW